MKSNARKFFMLLILIFLIAAGCIIVRAEKNIKPTADSDYRQQNAIRELKGVKGILVSVTVAGPDKIGLSEIMLKNRIETRLNSYGIKIAKDISKDFEAAVINVTVENYYENENFCIYCVYVSVVQGCVLLRDMSTRSIAHSYDRPIIIKCDKSRIKQNIEEVIDDSTNKLIDMLLNANKI